MTVFPSVCLCVCLCLLRYLLFGLYLHKVGYGIFDADEAQWLIPFLQKQSDTGKTIGNILKALRPVSQGGDKQYTEHAVKSFSGDPSGAGFRKGDCYTHTNTHTMLYVHTGTFRFRVDAGFIGFLSGRVPSQHVAVSSGHADADEHPIQNLAYYIGD